MDMNESNMKDIIVKDEIIQKFQKYFEKADFKKKNESREYKED